MSQDALRELSALCQQLRDAEREQAEAETAFKAKKSDVYRLATEDIPTLMQELGVKKIKLETGEQIEVKMEVEGSLPKEDLVARAAAFEWLEQNGHSGLIKTTVVTFFGRDEREKAQAVADMIKQNFDCEVLLGRDVHASTLRSFIKEQLAEGKPVPLDLFMARQYNKAKIK